MRRILIVGLLVAIAASSYAAKRLSVAKLQRLLDADSAARKPDAEIARQLEGIELTERMPDAVFAQLTARFGSRSQTAVALRLLADESEFVEPAPDQAAGQAAPDMAAQARMLDAAREYVSKTLRRLPNFLSTRVITRYDDTPHADKPGDWPTRLGLHLVTTVREPTSVSFDRDNQPAAQGSAEWRPGTGLVSGGEFGTTLGMVLADISKGEVSWSHWEQTSAGKLAVFHFSVPESASHFEVFSSFRREASTVATRSAPNVRGISGVTLQQNANSADVQLVRERPAYQGSIWVNPADGVVYRITMETDTKMGLKILRRAAILVEYGPVEIAGKRYICPVRSLAQADEVTTTESRLGDAATEWLNETVFTDYHRFGSSVRILGEEAKGPPTETGPGGEETTATVHGEAVAQNPSVSVPAQVAEEKTPPPSPAQTVATVPPASTEAGTATAPETNVNRSQTSEGAVPIAVASAAPPAVDTDTPRTAPLMPAAPQERDVTLQVNVNSLLVPTVVLDKNGEAVRDLSKQDFNVFDDGKRTKITGFTLLKSATIVAERNTKSGAEPAAERKGTTTESVPQQNRYLVFLFDDRHINLADLQLVKKAASKLFDQPLPEGEYAGVLSLTGANSGITRDDAALQAALGKLTVHQDSKNAKENCPNIDYYAADQILNHHNVTDFELAVQNYKQCSMLEVFPQATDPYSAIDNPNDPISQAVVRAADNALALGDEDARESLLTVQNVVRAMSNLPGKRILILVSPGFLTLSDETKARESEIMDLAAASDVTVNALDARGLEGSDISASKGGDSLGMVTGQLLQERNVSMQLREAVMSELALGTGGRFFHNNNDLAGGLKSLAAPPQDLYLLEISLSDVKADGSYHRLRVKVDRPGVEVLARKGYAAPKKEASKK